MAHNRCRSAGEYRAVIRSGVMIMRSLISFLYLTIVVCAYSAAGVLALRQAHHHHVPSRSKHVTTHHQGESRPPNEFHLDASMAAVPRGGGRNAIVDDEGDQDDALAKLAESVRSAIDNLLVRLGLKQIEIPPPPVEKPSIRSKVGTTLSIIGTLVAIKAVIELAVGNGEFFLQLDAASLVIAVLARLLSDSDVSCIINRGVIGLGILLGSMHLLTA